jgi:hypothetical protein
VGTAHQKQTAGNTRPTALPMGIVEVTMGKFKENYVVDDQGNPIGVVLDIADYRNLLEELEELESIRAYDAAKSSGDEAIPFEQAVAEIEQNRP